MSEDMISLLRDLSRRFQLDSFEQYRYPRMYWHYVRSTSKCDLPEVFISYNSIWREYSAIAKMGDDDGGRKYSVTCREKDAFEAISDFLTKLGFDERDLSDYDGSCNEA